MTSLVVIGNGFDIAHRLPTKYSDFMKFLKMLEKEPEYIMGNYVYAESISPHDRKKLQFYEEIIRYIPEDDLWNSFEEALGKLDHLQLQEDNSYNLINYAADDWSESANHDYQEMIAQDLSFISRMPQYFSEWIVGVNTCVSRCISQNIMSENNLFLNFNYTDTLESTYSIPASKILYLHGNALHGDRLILGHHDDSNFKEKPIPAFNTEEEWEEWEANLSDYDDDFREQEAREEIKSYFKKTYKNTALIVQENCGFFESLTQIEEVYILGHSLSVIDMDYFKAIKEAVLKNYKWYISYYSEQDYANAQKFVENLQIENFEFLTLSQLNE
ncbi:bacteriophage abortive infection AbiH family protein [Paenibacillus sp. FSL L8-0499]|uniref:bacteriophage abortive infection AbiH family protein n=1 Tax=Paenibacillus sp. FSL L8-0499 TaxID=2975334 RepID=UPI0030F8EFCB